MPRQVIAGNAIFPIARARDVLSMFAAYLPEAPDQLNLLPFMELPPAGKPGVVGVGVCWSGPAGGADAALRPIRQLGTALVDDIGVDAWNHMGHKNGVTYNCFNLLDDENLYATPDPDDPTKPMFSGYKAMGVDNFDPIITRGILLDVFAYKKAEAAAQGQDVTDFPPNDTVYTSEDLEDTMVAQGLTMTDFEPGDVIYVRTGNGYRFWTDDPEKPRDDRPAFFASLSARQLNDRGGQWIVNRQAIAYASDTNGGPHGTLLPQGVTLIEDLDLELLAEDAAAVYARTRDAKRAFIFATIIQPLRCRGCSGSAVAPVAVR